MEGENPNDFIAEIDVSLLHNRSSLEVAETFIHEVMHAEMRRYLFSIEQSDSTGSSIPGFPGSFTEDWNNYVKAKIGIDPTKAPGQVPLAEHTAMAENYIHYMVSLLSEYDSHGRLDDKYYRAVAWEGLTDTKAWEKAP